MGKVISPANGMRTHPAVRQLPLVIGKDAGGIYHKVIFQSGFFQQMLHHSLGRRGTADIAEAYEANFYFFFIHSAPLRQPFFSSCQGVVGGV